MKSIKIIAALSILVTATVLILSFSLKQKSEQATQEPNPQNQMVNFFVTHGHCSTPFSGKVQNLVLIQSNRTDQGNPLENMRISFNVNPRTFVVCRGEGLTEKVRKPGLFYNEDGDVMSFRTTEVFTMGIDWYQIHGKLTIKGVERNVTLFASGIRNPNESESEYLVLEGQFNLMDWGIDYDLIVNGKSDVEPTKMMHLNTRIDLDKV
ncbi:MAG: YceI family protein [Crocinitomicaceae bacterium]